jgi:hypothetical protein
LKKKIPEEIFKQQKSSTRSTRLVPEEPKVAVQAQTADPVVRNLNMEENEFTYLNIQKKSLGSESENQ